MKVGLAVVMQTSGSSEEADFTSEVELQHMTDTFRGLGHELVCIDFSSPLSDIAAQIEEGDPDVIFNTVEQVRGEARPAGLVPTVCHALGRRCTGPGPRAITIGSDKWLTKRAASAGPVRFPRDASVTSDGLWDESQLEGLYPVIAKPNYGGSSQGITAHSIAYSPADVDSAIGGLGPFLSSGVLIEEFIPGRDITVACVESGGEWQVLAPIEYLTPSTDGQHLLTERLKRWEGWVDVIPRYADGLSPEQHRELETHALAIVQAVGAAGAARLDFRLSDSDDRLYALEINVIANIEAEAGLALSAQHAGLGHQDLISLMLDSAK